MKIYPFIITAILSCLITLYITYTGALAHANSTVRLDKVNEIVRTQTSNVNAMKTAIAICLQRNTNKQGNCPSPNNRLPVIDNLTVLNSNITITLPLPELSTITLAIKDEDTWTNGGTLWYTTCTGNKDMIFLAYYDNCNTTILAQ
jgi:hypothetical protein